MIGSSFGEVDGLDTIMLPGQEYRVDNAFADELISRGLADEKNKTRSTARKAEAGDGSKHDSGDTGRSKGISKSGRKRRRQSNNGNAGSRRKSGKKSNKSKSGK